MVQRKVVNNKKHGIEGVTLKTDNKKQAITKPSIQNHDGKSKGADLKAVKVKKSRPVKRSNNVDEIISHHSTPMKTNKLVTPMKTPSPSPKKLLLSCKSPNYMKSTSSSEARKERSITSKESNTNSNSNSNSNSIAKLHKVGKTVNKLSNMKKMIGLTKSPSFKHTRSGGGGGGRKKNKVVICEKDIDVQRATCSSTLKDCKFPTNLNKLKAGAGESEAAIGISSLSVCLYTYCYLNGNHHHHVSVPPLKRFILSSIEEEEEEEEGDCEVQVYVPLPAIDRVRVRVRVREGGLGKVVSVCDEIDVSSDGDIDYDFGDDQTDEDDTTLPAVMNYPLQTQASFESQSSPSGDNSYSDNDMEWEEGNEVIEFKPRSREPNFLAMKPDPEAEKVDLRHQQMDERRNADEWMLDYALQKTVTQLAPARNRNKVALLVEAFESVLPPIPIFHPHSSHIISRNTSGFFNATPIQACR